PRLDVALLAALSRIPILARRMRLQTPGVLATVPMLRGTWGAALHDLDPAVYARVFEGASPESPGPANQSSRTPGYILRPAPPDPEFAPAVDWILFGAAIGDDRVLRRAWDVASGMGLGPRRERFQIPQVRRLNPDGSADPLVDGLGDSCNPYTLDQTVWPAGDPCAPCRLMFDVPLRLLRQKSLIESPTLADLVVAASRRVEAYLPRAELELWCDVARGALNVAREVPCEPWQGERLDLQRYSARQQAELELRGVTGCLSLPAGPGVLWPLLAAAQWLHLGKSTILGLGQFHILSG
ncbi:MAG: CRISPR system precrRNA processing endoribonuclease RAMP protein Cas6, partial [Planctomycetota bacterium]|nr:CRISPR system precrRNA processing endoribonuclease RAMP protein Cas6 [Planctomycetota bacterium]